MLKINNLSKKFGDFQVLSNVNLAAEVGQIYGLVGSNGCGKTTLLKHIMNIYKQDSGNIFLHEDEVKENSELKNDFYYVQDNLYFPYQYSLSKLFEYEKLMYKNMSQIKFESLANFFKIDKYKNLNQNIAMINNISNRYRYTSGNSQFRSSVVNSEHSKIMNYYFGNDFNKAAYLPPEMPQSSTLYQNTLNRRERRDSRRGW